LECKEVTRKKTEAYRTLRAYDVPQSDMNDFESDWSTLEAFLSMSRSCISEKNFLPCLKSILECCATDATELKHKIISHLSLLRFIPRSRADLYREFLLAALKGHIAGDEILKTIEKTPYYRIKFKELDKTITQTLLEKQSAFKGAFQANLRSLSQRIPNQTTDLQKRNELKALRFPYESIEELYRIFLIEVLDNTIDPEQILKLFDAKTDDKGIRDAITQLLQSWKQEKTDSLAIDTLKKRKVEQPFDPPALKIPSIINPSLYLEEINRSGQDAANVTSELENKLLNNGDPWLNDVVDDIRAYNEQEQSKTKLSTCNQRELDHLVKDLQHSIQKSSTELIEDEKSILALANKAPKSSKAKIARFFKRLRFHHRDVASIEDLLYPALQGKLQDWKQINPSLSSEEIHTLEQMTFDYLVKATELQHLQRTADLAIKMQKNRLELASNKNNPQELHKLKIEYDQLDTLLCEQLNTQRAYQKEQGSAINNITRFSLIFEFLGNMRIKPKQMKIVENILEGKINDEERDFIIQLIMGGGKSAIILPLLALILANGENLPIICIPREQIGVQKDNLNAIASGKFARHVHTLDIDRTTVLDDRKIREIHLLIEQCIRKKECLTVTPETLEALELKWHDLRRTCATSKSSYEDLKLLSNVFSIFKKSGILLMEEADKIMDIRSELIFTLGDDKEIGAHTATFIELYKILSQYPELHLQDPKQIPSNKEIQSALEKAASSLADKIVVELFAEKDIQKSRELAEFLIKPNQHAPQWVTSIKDKAVLGRIGLLKGELTVYLPLTLSKNDLKDYAFSEKPAIFQAIPARFCVPKESSRPGTNYESVNYTLQLLLKHGFSSSQIDFLVGKIEEEMMYSILSKTPVEDIELLRMVKKLLPEKKDMRTSLSKDEIILLRKRMHQDPETLLRLAEIYIIPTIRYYSSNTTQNSHRFIEMFGRAFGFTGTPSNWGGWPKRLGKPILDKGTDGYTISLLIKKAKALGKQAVVVDDTDLGSKDAVKNIIHTFRSNSPAEYRALIDLGAYFKGKSNEQVAQDILHSGLENIQGVVFFKKDKLYVMTKTGTIPYEKCTLKPEELFTFYDNAHIIGADIPQSMLAHAIVTVGAYDKLNELLQAVWRMRGLGFQQNVSLLVNKPIASIIEQNVGPLTVDSIIEHTAKNQAMAQREDTFRGINARLSARLRSKVVDKLLELDHSDQYTKAAELFSLFDGVDGIFKSKQEFNPWSHFGVPTESILTDQLLQQFRDNWKAKLEELKKFETSDLHYIESLTHEIDAWYAESKEYLNRMNATQESRQGVEIGKDIDINVEKEQDFNINLDKENIQNDAENILQGPYWDNFKPLTLEFQITSPSNFLGPTNPGVRKGIFPLSDVLGDSSFLAEGAKPAAVFADLFKGPFYVSYNLAPVLIYNTKPPVVFLRKHQRPLNHLIVRETGDSKTPYEFYLIDPTDLEKFRKEIATYNQEISTDFRIATDFRKGSTVRKKLWIYSPHLHTSGLQTSLSNPKKCMGSKEFAAEIVKIYLLTGFNYLSDLEYQAMKNLIRMIGPTQFQTLIKATRGEKLSEKEKHYYTTLIKEVSQEPLVA